MRYKISIPCILILVGTRIYATALKGKIVEYPSTEKPISQVEVTSKGYANPTVTNNKGMFQLNFPDKQPGDNVNLNVKKRGYVVVLADQLKQTLPKNADMEPIKISLCKEKIYKQRILSLSTYNHNDSEMTSRQIIQNLLEESYFQNNLAVEYTKQNLADKARKAYGEALNISMLLAKQEPQNYLLDVLMILNNLCVLQIWQNKNLEDHKVYIEVLTILEYQDNVRNIIKRDTSILREEIPTITCEKLLNNIDQLVERYSLINNPFKLVSSIEVLDYLREKNALDLYNEALDINHELAELDPQTYLIHEANVRNNLGILHSNLNRLEDASMAFRKAHRIYHELAEQNQWTYEPHEARTLNNLGILYMKQNRMGEARKVLEEAQRIYEVFARQNPDRNIRYVAHVKRLLEEINKTEQETNGH